MSRPIIVPVLATVGLGVVMIVGSSAPVTAAQRGAVAKPTGDWHPARTTPPGVGDVGHVGRAVTGRPAGIARPLGPAARAAASGPDRGRVTYNGGPVQQHPVVYLVFWGPWWQSTANPGGGGAALETDLYQLFHGVGQAGDAWSTTLSQYRDSSGKGPVLGTGVWGNWAVDTASTPPPGATAAQIAAEAASWADHWGVAGDVNAQVFVVSPQGVDPIGFPTNYCAWHDQTTDASGKFVAYVNLPYLPDAGASCGAATVAGSSIVTGHEFAETVTDPGAEATSGTVTGAWYDGPSSVNPDDEEIGDKCAWFELGSVTLPNGTYPMQRLWSNASSTCVLARGPAVTGLSASHGPTAGGEPVTVFGARLLGGSVIFGSQPAASATCTPTSCSVQSPPGSLGVVDVRVSTSGGQSAAVPADRFSYDVGPGQVSGSNGRCLNDAHGSAANGNKIDIWTCVSSRIGQAWLFEGDHSLRVVGRCLSLTGLFSGARAVLAGCAGLASEYWRARPASTGLVEYVNPASGLCLTDPRNSTANGTAVVVRACAKLKGQRWSYP